MTENETPLIKKIFKEVYFRCDEIDNPILYDSLSKITKNDKKAKKLIDLAKEGLNYANYHFDTIPKNMCKIKLNGYDASYMEYDNLLDPEPKLIQSVLVKFSLDGDIEIANLRKIKNSTHVLKDPSDYYLPNTEEYNIHKKFEQFKSNLDEFKSNKKKMF